MIEVSKKRLKFLDDAKGLGMMMIVWMHIWGNNTFEFAPLPVRELHFENSQLSN